MVWKEGVSLMGTPSNQALKEGGYPPHPPSVEGGSREPGTEVRGGYIESRGKPVAFSLPKVTWLFMFGSCSDTG